MWHIYILAPIAIGVTIVRSAKVRGIIMGIAMSEWRLFRLLIMSLRQMTFISTISFLVLLIAVFIIAAVIIGTFQPVFMMGPKMMRSGI